MLNEIGAPINGAIRIAALFGYLGVFLTSLSSNYMRELTRYFGRQFIKVHHITATASLIALVLHATLVAVRSGTASVFLPQISSVLAFLSMGGVPALWLLAITVVTAILKTTIGNKLEDHPLVELPRLHPGHYPRAVDRVRLPQHRNAGHFCGDGAGARRRLLLEADAETPRQSQSGQKAAETHIVPDSPRHRLLN